ncbi:hypothetical protein NW762_006005 [Fusarium torreyae]|uniref:Uncharacterized protein n=1 Tax=Fusarium torreyae TaxID=1237075 RepID=A0A9W8S145_9HYPO|nr:hypothetical protein NW762_006005 [Fusarium torreyae]
MSLTPVRIRGKRKYPSTSRPPSDLRTHTSAPGDSGSRPIKKMKRSLSNVLASRATRWRPVLQALPSEVLESIFLYSANISLPRSSPIMGAKLSGRATLIRFFIWAFHDTWDQCFGISKTEAASDKSSAVGGDRYLQSTILDLPWVNTDFILQAQQTWVDTYARDRHYKHYLPRLDVEGDPLIYSHGHEFEGGVGHFNSRECFEADYQEVLAWEPFANVGEWGGCDVHPRIRIPMVLITGPWNEERLRLLFWLRRGGKIYGLEEHESSWEIQLDCLRNAFIEAPEPTAMITNLIDLTALCRGLPRDIAREERRRIEQRLKWGADNVVGKEILREVYMRIGMFHDGFDAPGSPK